MEDLIKNTIIGGQQVSQFGVSKVPFHTHNKTDSPQVAFSNLSKKFMTFSFTLFGTQAATAGNYSVFFTAPFALSVSQITEVHTALGTDGSAVSLDIEKLTGTTAPGSGTAITASPFNLKSTINTVVTGTLSTTIGTVNFAVGNRMALKLTGTPTSVANVTVTLLINF